MKLIARYFIAGFFWQKLNFNSDEISGDKIHVNTTRNKIIWKETSAHTLFHQNKNEPFFLNYHRNEISDHFGRNEKKC